MPEPTDELKDRCRHPQASSCIHAVTLFQCRAPVAICAGAQRDSQDIAKGSMSRYATTVFTCCRNLAVYVVLVSVIRQSTGQDGIHSSNIAM